MSGRRRSAFEILLCACAACAAEPVSARRGGFDVASRDYGSAAAPAASRTVTDRAMPEPGRREGDVPRAVEAGFEVDPSAQERLLREEFAASGEPAEAALDLAGFLCSRERFDEALAVVDKARGRSADPRLRVARIGLLRDLGRRATAAAELRTFVAERGAADLHPGLLFELAELEWLEADFTGAKAALAELSRVHGGDPWCNEHRDRIDAVASAVLRERPATKGLRDLLGDLRGAPAVAARLAAFHGIMAVVRPQGDDAERGLYEQAVGIAIGDESPEVRVQVVKAADPGSAIARAVAAAALADDAPSVRATAARRVLALDPHQGRSLLLDRLAAEDDAGVFVELHRSLAVAVGDAPPLPEDGAASSASRAAIVAAWRERCAR